MSEVEKIADLLKAMLRSDQPNVRKPTPSQWKSLSQGQLQQMGTKWKDTIPKDHPDHAAMVSHVNFLIGSGNIQDAGQLSDRYLTGGGDHAKDRPMNKSLDDSSINIIAYSDGTVDLEFGPDVPEVLEKSAVEYIRSQGYEEILDKGLKAEHKSPKGGMTAAGVKAYRRENPGSKLQTAVSEKNPKGKRAKRRRSFCARMSGMPGPMKDKKGRPTRKALALRRWRC
jgi:hypothetical protein